MKRDSLLIRVKAILGTVFGDRLQGVVLFGSEVRGEAQPDSDIDLLVLLRDVKDWGDDLDLIIKSRYEIQLEIFRPLDITPVDIEEYMAGEYPLYRLAQREGVWI